MPARASSDGSLIPDAAPPPDVGGRHGRISQGAAGDSEARADASLTYFYDETGGKHGFVRE